MIINLWEYSPLSALHSQLNYPLPRLVHVCVYHATWRDAKLPRYFVALFTSTHVFDVPARRATRPKLPPLHYNEVLRFGSIVHDVLHAFDALVRCCRIAVTRDVGPYFILAVLNRHGSAGSDGF